MTASEHYSGLYGLAYLGALTLSRERSGLNVCPSRSQIEVSVNRCSRTHRTEPSTTRWRWQRRSISPSDGFPIVRSAPGVGKAGGVEAGDAIGCQDTCQHRP